MNENNDLKFPTVLKQIREHRNLTIRALSKLCGYSPAYICDLENANRIATIQVIENIAEKLCLSKEEYKILLSSYNYDRSSIPQNLARYLIKNDLIEYIEIIKELDQNGTAIKNLAMNLKHQKLKR